MSNEAFKRAFAEVIRRAGAKAELVVRKTAIDLASAVVLKSPVDTGRFRANWMTAIGALSQVTVPDVDKGGTVAAGRASTAVATWRPGQTIFITNSLPYSRRLEFEGWSKQAPAGMVRITVREYGQYLQKAVGEAKGTP